MTNSRDQYLSMKQHTLPAGCQQLSVHQPCQQLVQESLSDRQKHYMKRGVHRIGHCDGDASNSGSLLKHQN